VRQAGKPATAINTGALNMKILHNTLIVAAGLLTIAPMGAQADGPVTTQTVAVSYAQLDLGNSKAVDTLYRQLANAAERACGAYEARNLRERSAWRECRETAFSAGVAKLVEARIVNAEIAPVIASIAVGY
jgi:UrcA family protein